MSSKRSLNVGAEIMAACPSKASFLGLPVEIRLEIYRYLLSSKYIRRKLPYQNSRLEMTYYSYPFHKQILRTNRQVHKEAIYIFRMENLFVRFTTNHPSVQHILWATQVLLSLTHGKSYFRCAMEIDHYCPPSRTKDHKGCNCTEGDFATCLLVSDQLPNLLRTLRAFSQQGDRSLAKSSFSVHIFYRFEQSFTKFQPGFPFVHPRIRNLLDPFKIFYDVESLKIKGRVNEEYKQSIISSATQPEPTVAEIITAASAIKERGDEAFRKHQFDLSLSLYTTAINEFQVNHHWIEYTGIVTTGEYARMNTAHAAWLLKIRLHSNVAAALVKVDEYRRATDHAREAIRQIVTSERPSEEWEGLVVKAADRAKPFLWGGLAYEGLGDLNRAIYGVGEALFYYPGNTRLAKDYKRLEAEIDKRGIEPARHEFGKGTDWHTYKNP